MLTATRLIKRILPRGLMGRSILIIVMPLILLQVISTVVFYERHWASVTRRMVTAVAGDIAVIVNFLHDFPGPENERWILNRALSRMSISATLERGARIATEPPPRTSNLDRILGQKLGEQVGLPYWLDTTSLREQVLVDIQIGDDVLRAIIPRRRLASVTTSIFVMWMVGSSLVLFAIAAVFMRNQVKAVRRLAAAAESFGKGRDVPSFKPSGAAEVRQAAAAFILMRERIKRQIEQRTEMLAGVSHDLHTPLTRMKLQLAMLGDSPEIEELRSDVEEMERMVEGYLSFARGESMEQAKPTDVSEILEAVVNGARRQGGAIDLHTEGPLVVSVRPNALRRCVANLVANATRYAEHVSVRAGRREDAIEITIDDDGPGIPEDQRESVFRPFYRLDPSRNPDTGGVGLGLTIARDIIRGHGGEVILGDSPFGGLRARLRLPV